MMVPYWLLEGQRPNEGNEHWGLRGVPPPYQARPVVSMPFYPSAMIPINTRIIRPRSALKPGPVVYPRHLLFPKSAVKQEKVDQPTDLGNLDRMLNFDLTNILPPNFGFPDIEEERRQKRVDPAPSNQTGEETNTAPWYFQPQHMFSGGVAGYVTDDIMQNRKEDGEDDDGRGSPRLVIDTDAAQPSTSVSDDHQRPPYSYIELIDLAMRHQGEMTVREIYQWIMDNFEYYRNTEPSKWQPSVRHALTISPAFIKIKKVRGGNLWGHASAREQALARKQKNHWKKQKIEEYVKTSNRRRRKKDEGLNTSSSSVDTNPDFFVSDLNSALTSALENNTAPQEVEEEEDEEEDMEGVEYEEVPPARPHIGKSSGKASKASSARSTPAKKAKRSNPQSEEPVVEIVKTHTRHGRVTNKLNYKQFSCRGKMDFISVKSIPERSRSPSPNIHTKENADDGPNYTSDETNEDGDFEGEMFNSDLPEKKDIIVTGNCSRHQTPIDMLTPEDSPASTSNAKILQAVSNVTPRNSSTRLIKSFDQTSDQNGTPAHLVVSDLQDFEPTESTESLLASTSGLTSFASTSEAAMILSSLEAFPRQSACETESDTTYSIEIMVENVIEEVEEDPENPIPRSLESSQTISITSTNLKREPLSDSEAMEDKVTLEEVVTIENSENLSEKPQGTTQNSPKVNVVGGISRNTGTPDIVEVVVEIVSPAVETMSIKEEESSNSPIFSIQTVSSPVQQKPLPSLALNSTPGSTLLASPQELKNVQVRCYSSPHTSTHSSPILRVTSAPCGSQSPPLPPLLQPCPMSQPQLSPSLPKPHDLTSMFLTTPAQPNLAPTPPCRAMRPPMRPTAFTYVRPCTLPRPPPLRPCGSNPAYRFAPSGQSSRNVPNSAAWTMPDLTQTVFVDIEDVTPQSHLIYQDVPLSDAWRKNTPCEKCCTQGKGAPSLAAKEMPNLTAKGMPSLTATTSHHNTHTRKDMVPPLRYVTGGSLRSPVYGRGLRPVTAASIPYPVLHPFPIVPSPIRAEQTAQAFMPTGHHTPRMPSATTRLTRSPYPAQAKMTFSRSPNPASTTSTFSRSPTPNPVTASYSRSPTPAPANASYSRTPSPDPVTASCPKSLTTAPATASHSRSPTPHPATASYSRSLTPNTVTASYSPSLTPDQATASYSRSLTPHPATASYSRSLTPNPVTASYSPSLTPDQATASYSRSPNPAPATASYSRSPNPAPATASCPKSLTTAPATASCPRSPTPKPATASYSESSTGAKVTVKSHNDKTGLADAQQEALEVE